MKRAQRKLHFLIWIGVSAIIALIIGFGMLAIAPEPQNDALPNAITEGDG